MTDPEARSSLWPRVILRITGHFRRRRGALLAQAWPGLAAYRVCDLGGSRHFWLSAAPQTQPAAVEVLNISMEDINAAGVSDEPLGGGAFTYEVYDGSDIPRPDDYYDLLICNSVLEHVPPAQRAALSGEMARVAPRLFVQTPAKGFVVDPHFIMPMVHWVPRGVGRYLARVSPWRLLTRATAQQADEYFHGTQLLGRRELRAYFPGASLVVERFLGLPKSYVMIVGAEGARDRDH
ncbi:MAG: methyltransferase domain-containing protein [Lapillicoccus sp.]